LIRKDDDEYHHGLAVQDLTCGQELPQNFPKVFVVVLTGAIHVLGWFTDNNLEKIKMLSLSEAYGRTNARFVMRAGIASTGASYVLGWFTDNNLGNSRCCLFLKPMDGNRRYPSHLDTKR
jgi:hypothetical protein